MVGLQHASSDDRREPRQDVLHRTRVVQANGAERIVTIVNVSAHGFMARADGEWADGDMLAVVLPDIGAVKAEVRWALGGRIGCRLLQPIELDRFTHMLHQMRRSA